MLLKILHDFQLPPANYQWPDGTAKIFVLRLVPRHGEGWRAFSGVAQPMRIFTRYQNDPATMTVFRAQGSLTGSYSSSDTDPVEWYFDRSTPGSELDDETVLPYQLLQVEGDMSLEAPASMPRITYAIGFGFPVDGVVVEHVSPHVAGSIGFAVGDNLVNRKDMVVWR